MMRILNTIRRRLLGPYRMALREGLKVGKGLSLVGNTDFGSEPYLITIGDHVRISKDVMFITHDGGTWAFRDQNKFRNVIKYGKIKVGSHTFIGARVTIMPGVTIGERCVIGTGSVVTKDIPDGMVACGVPAKIIMSIEEYAEKSLANMKPYDIDAYQTNKKEYLQKWL